MAPSLTIPRAVYVDLDVDESAKTIKLAVGEALTISNLFILSSVNRMPQNGLGKSEKISKYVVNGLFGNDDFESLVRVTLVTKQAETSKVLDQVITLQTSRETPSIKVTKSNLATLRQLVFQGVLN